MSNISGAMLNARAERVRKANEGWWRDLETGAPLRRNMGEMVMLIVSELAEAMEGHRKGRMDDHLPGRRMAEVEVADALIRCLDVAAGTGVIFGDSWTAQRMAVPENFGEGLLHLTDLVANIYDAHCRAEATQRAEDRERYCGRFWQAINALLDFAQHHGLDIWGAYEEKMAYNAVRADHQAAHRRAPGGKKY